MNNEEKQSPTQIIEKEIKEKTKQLKELADKVSQAKTFVEQNEPNIFALNGAIQELTLIKQELS